MIGPIHEDIPSLTVDLVAHDARGHDVLLVKVTGIVLSPEVVSRFFEIMESLSPSTPFSMVVDLESIHLRRNGTDLPARRLETAPILGCYEPEYGRKPIFHPYLQTLVASWLHDLAYHWKSEIPPGSDELAELGLLEKLEGGTTDREVLIGEDSLR